MELSSMWEMTDYIQPLILPPVISKRKRDDNTHVSDGTRTYTCNNCLQKGHNTRSCKNPKQDKPPKLKKKRGRPRIHEPGVMGSRSNTTRMVKVNPFEAEDNVVASVGMQESKDMGFETKDAPLFDHVPITQTNKDAVVDVHFHDVGLQESEESIHQSTEDAAKQEKFKHLRDAGYTSDDIEEAVSITENETRAPVYEKNARRSERILKIKLSKPVYDKDGGGSCVEKALTLD